MARRAWMMLLPLAAAALGCRTAKERGDESALVAPSTVWYDAAGKAGACDESASVCQSYGGDRTFSDVCLAKGFEVKVCGCQSRCSGQTGYVQPQAAAAPAALALAGPAVVAAKPVKTSPPARACTAEAKDYIGSVAQAREPGALLTRCLDTHVCNGNVGWCVGDSLRASLRLRAMARLGCDGEVYDTICRDGFLDSLGCPDADIQKLSHLWVEFYAKDSSVKRCVRNVVCSNEETFCAADALAQAKDIKASVNRDGCEYWLRMLCNQNGGKAW